MRRARRAPQRRASRQAKLQPSSPHAVSAATCASPSPHQRTTVCRGASLERASQHGAHAAGPTTPDAKNNSTQPAAGSALARTSATRAQHGAAHFAAPSRVVWPALAAVYVLIVLIICPGLCRCGDLAPRRGQRRSRPCTIARHTAGNPHPRDNPARHPVQKLLSMSVQSSQLK